MGLIKKLLLKPGYRAAVLNPPDGFGLPEEELPEGVVLTNGLEEAGELDFALLFARNQEELGKTAPLLLPRLKPDAVFWTAYPKKSSKLKSDITRDSGWDVLKEAGFEGVSLVSIDETWSAFRLRPASAVNRANR
ncbi:hypothetical protein J31TS4_21930 [Paenibacillus sp. J31TS4]|uniref:hypothetical protein n=1 Tax=Paenibacillus sp. J31TS4 TaxID=2807195 RepID=UPI001B1E04FB|nr:hypothetical protein [Paenibacillus sp. J31TS4]GIP38913.1 hypothetical protein J31TS4_21930 [Paenibacillus sp. J31TS4]